MEFKVDVTESPWDPGITVIRLRGSVDAQTAPEFEKVALAAIARGKKRILVDCKDLDFISSAGIGVFMVLLGEVEKDGFLKAMNLSEEVYESFDLLGIPEVMEICRDEKEAKKACS